jgi:hypothetical protein
VKDTTAELTARYRRLLRWYPRDHRDSHGEEMLDVLLAGAGDRTHPTRKESVDLVRGAVVLHLRRATGLDGGIDHRDVLAIVSLLGPVVMLAGAAPALDVLVDWLRTGSPLTMLYAARIPDAPVWVMWFVVAVLSLFRMRRTAAAGAWLATFAFLPAASFGLGYFWDLLAVQSGWILLGVVVAAALTWSPGPARGWELVGVERFVVLVVSVGASAAFVIKSIGSNSVLHLPMAPMMAGRGSELMVIWFVSLTTLVVGAAVGASVRTRVGRRAASVLCVPVVVSLLMVVLPYDVTFLVASAVCYGVPLVMLMALGSLPRRVSAW